MEGHCEWSLSLKAIAWLCFHNLKVLHSETFWMRRFFVYSLICVYVYAYCTHTNQHILERHYTELVLDACETNMHFSSCVFENPFSVGVCFAILVLGVLMLPLDYSEFSGCATGVHWNFKLTNFWSCENVCTEKFLVQTKWNVLAKLMEFIHIAHMCLTS